MKRTKRILQTYREYTSYADYPEGQTRETLIRAIPINKERAEELKREGVVPERLDNYEYYRVTLHD